MLPAMFIAMVTAITVWWLLIQRLKEKPWTTQGVVATSQETITSSAPKVGLWVFLAVVTSLFGLFASAYVMRMHDGHGALVSWTPVDEPSLLWINTVVLVLASGAMQIARGRVDRDDFAGLRGYIVGAGLLTIAFLGGQVLAWNELHTSGNYGRENPAYAFFILITAIHGLHLLGGLLVIARTWLRVSRNFEKLNDKLNVVARSQIRTSLQLCTVYWHWLLLIWLGLFALLLST